MILCVRSILNRTVITIAILDMSGQVPAGLDFKVALQQEKVKEKQRHTQEYRQRRLSDSSVHNIQL